MLEMNLTFMEIPITIVLGWITWRLVLVEKSVDKIREFLSQGGVTKVDIDPKALVDVMDAYTKQRMGNPTLFSQMGGQDSSKKVNDYFN